MGKRKALSGALLSLFIAVLFVFLPVSVKGEIVERVAGVIGDEVYTLSDLEAMATHFGLKPEEGTNPLDRRLKKEAFLREVWRRLVEEQILKMEAKRLGLDVKDEEVERVLEQLRRRHRLSKEGLTRELAAQGFTLEGYREYLKTQMRKARIIEALIKPKISPKEEDLFAYYQAHRDRYTAPTKVRVFHIFIYLPEGATPREEKRAEERLEKVLNALQRGEPFSDVATLYSQDPSAKYGGDMGFVTAKEIDPELWEAIKELDVGEISPVIRSSKGYHIFMVAERRGETPLAFQKVREKVLQDYFKEEVERRYKEWLSGAERKIGVRGLI